MSCRIDRVVGSNDIVVLCVSGRITKQDVDTLLNVIEDEARTVAIHLKNLDLVDQGTVKFLTQRNLNGTGLRNCSPYIRE
jgi:hypothetical protein